MRSVVGSDVLLIVLFSFQDVFRPNQRWTWEVSGRFIIPGLPEKRFVKLGDINIGMLVPMSRYDRRNRCSHRMSTSAIHYTQVMFFSVVCIVCVCVFCVCCCFLFSWSSSLLSIIQ